MSICRYCEKALENGDAFSTYLTCENPDHNIPIHVWCASIVASSGHRSIFLCDECGAPCNHDGTFDGIPIGAINPTPQSAEIAIRDAIARANTVLSDARIALTFSKNHPFIIVPFWILSSLISWCIFCAVLFQGHSISSMAGCASIIFSLLLFVWTFNATIANHHSIGIDMWISLVVYGIAHATIFYITTSIAWAFVWTCFGLLWGVIFPIGAWVSKREARKSTNMEARAKCGLMILYMRYISEIYFPVVRSLQPDGKINTTTTINSLRALCDTAYDRSYKCKSICETLFGNSVSIMDFPEYYWDRRWLWHPTIV